MDLKLKQTALKNLARTAGELAENALKKEAEKIATTLQIETQYDHINDQLELLDTIAYRVHEQAVGIIHHLLGRLSNLELTYPDVLGFPAERLQEYQNKNTLIIKILELLEHIRYHETSAILDIFFEYSMYEEESVAKQAKHGLEALAGYDIDIFYSNNKGWGGLGEQPQEKIIEKILSFNDTQKCNYFAGIISACQKMLSPTIEGTSWSYKSVTLRSGAVPAIEGIKEVRRNTLKILSNLYPLADSIEQKKSVINTMDAATHTPHMGDYGDDVLTMIVADTITVLEFMKETLSSDDMQIMQKIEHDAYWTFHHMHSLNPAISKTALEIRDLLAANQEYQKFRVLIGFESIFHEWEKGKDKDSFEYERTFRESEAFRLACEIHADTYTEWKIRIIRYASIQSNDMATFPYFGKFLEHFGKSSPLLAFRLLSEVSEQFPGFLIPILYGISQTEQKKSAYELIANWCEQGKYLFSLARFFEFTPEVDEDLLTKIADKAKECNDVNTLNQVIISITEQYKEESKHLVKELLIPVLGILTTHQNSGWIFGFWFRKQRRNILAAMDTVGYEAILDNLFWLDQINHQAEEILCNIATYSPELVLHFFCNRLSKEKENRNRRNYDAIPFNFHDLSEPLSTIPEQAVNIIRETFDGNYGMFIFSGAQLLRNIFPDFPHLFQQKLLQLIQTKEKDNLLFVMAVLRNYEGNPIIREVCKELIKTLPENDDLLRTEVNIILQSTGVVSGEYGFVEAYTQKIDEMKAWLEDEDNQVKNFAREYISALEKRIEVEQKSATEEIILRKHQYGLGNDEEAG